MPARQTPSSANVANPGFCIEPGLAFLCLERDGLLEEMEGSELAPLRRLAEQNPLPLVWDSRSLPQKTKLQTVAKPEPQLIYVARAGGNFDGHTLAEDVLAAGNLFVGQAALVEKHLRAVQRPAQWIREILSHPYFLAVHNTERALQHLLRHASGLNESQFTSLAVTGTNGKTSFVQIAGTLLEVLSGEPILKMGTLGIQIQGVTTPGSHPTMPDFPTFLTALARLKSMGGKQLCLEATSHGLVGERLGDWNVDVAVFTNLTPDHLDFHGNMMNYRNAKAILFRTRLKHGGTAVINAASPEASFFCKSAQGKHVALIGYGPGELATAFLKQNQSQFASVRYLATVQDAPPAQGMRGLWRLLNESGTAQEAGFGCSLVGDFQLENVGAAVAAMVALGYPLAQIAAAVREVTPIPGRLEAVLLEDDARRNQQPVVLVDYAHTPDALKRALETCRKLLAPEGKLVCVFGCGGERDVGKRPAMGEIASTLANWTILTSDNPRSEDPALIVKHIAAGTKLGAKVSFELDRKKAITMALADSKKGDVVLIAGKGHETEQIYGDKKIPFNDVLVVRTLLESLYPN